MTEGEYKNKKDSITPLAPIASPPEIPKSSPLAPDISTYLAVLEALQRPKRHLTTAPTFIPRNLTEQIQFYDSGGVRRLYVYLNGAWRYVTLT